MRSLLNTLRRLPEFEDLLLRIDARALSRGGVRAVAGTPGPFAAGGHRACAPSRPVVLVCADEGEAERLAKDVWPPCRGSRCCTLPAREFTFHNAATVSRQWEHRRLAALRAMAAGERAPAGGRHGGGPAPAHPAPRPRWTRASPGAADGGELRPERAGCDRLTAAGYARCEQVEGVGQFALRGGILDFYSPAARAARPGGVLRGRTGRHGRYSTRPPSAGWRTSSRSEILPAAEALPQLAPGRDCWGWPATRPRRAQVAAAKRRKRSTLRPDPDAGARTGSGWRAGAASRPRTATLA